MRKKGANRERLIARVAANQHGVVAKAQLAAAGIPDYSITRRVQAGRGGVVGDERLGEDHARTHARGIYDSDRKKAEDFAAASDEIPPVSPDYLQTVPFC